MFHEEMTENTDAERYLDKSVLSWNSTQFLPYCANCEQPKYWSISAKGMVFYVKIIAHGANVPKMGEPWRHFNQPKEVMLSYEFS